MAHTASVGSVKRTVNVIGKRLGVKRFGSQFVKAGEIIIRQRGSEFYPGKNSGVGKDYTIFSKITGFVSFRKMSGFKRGKKYVDVLAEMPLSRTEQQNNPTEEIKMEVTKTTKATKSPKAKSVK